MIKGSIHQEDKTIINIHTPNRPPKYMKQQLTETKGELDNSTTVGEFNTSLLITNRTIR